MSRNRSSERDARLRDLLRQGDPASGEPGLSTEEIHAMRRAVLSAAPERRRFGLLPALAMGMAAALAVLLAVALWRGGGPQGVQPPEEKVATVTPEPVRPPAPPVAAEPPAPETPEDAAPPEEPVVKEPVRKRQAAPRATPALVLGEPEPPMALASVPEPSLPEPGLEEPRTRHIEFSTPGGTRVIWVLTGDETLLK
ncbi:MAG TPA: hypothetical protein VE685_05820 [Thermoanaerobaculia bacterium]|nr:hypothetical protein [Thermoanaerobaculia bacterium]